MDIVVSFCDGKQFVICTQGAQGAVAGGIMGAALVDTACANHRVMDGYLPLKTQSMRCIILSHPYSRTQPWIPFSGLQVQLILKEVCTTRW